MSLERIEVGITGITAILIWDTSGVAAAAVVPQAVSAPGRSLRGRSRMTCWRPALGVLTKTCLSHAKKLASIRDGNMR